MFSPYGITETPREIRLARKPPASRCSLACLSRRGNEIRYPRLSSSILLNCDYMRRTANESMEFELLFTLILLSVHLDKHIPNCNPPPWWSDGMIHWFIQLLDILGIECRWLCFHNIRRIPCHCKMYSVVTNLITYKPNLTMHIIFRCRCSFTNKCAILIMQPLFW